MVVVLAVIFGSTLFSSMPCLTARAIYSGNRTLESIVRKNFSTGSEYAPFAWISNRLSWRWKASVPSSAVPL